MSLLLRGRKQVEEVPTDGCFSLIAKLIAELIYAKALIEYLSPLEGSCFSILTACTFYSHSINANPPMLVVSRSTRKIYYSIVS
jgi:hypothetical protein